MINRAQQNWPAEMMANAASTLPDVRRDFRAVLQAKREMGWAWMSEDEKLERTSEMLLRAQAIKESLNDL